MREPREATNRRCKLAVTQYKVGVALTITASAPMQNLHRKVYGKPAGDIISAKARPDGGSEILAVKIGALATVQWPGGILFDSLLRCGSHWSRIVAGQGRASHQASDRVGEVACGRQWSVRPVARDLNSR